MGLRLEGRSEEVRFDIVEGLDQTPSQHSTHGISELSSILYKGGIVVREIAGVILPWRLHPNISAAAGWAPGK